MLNTHVLQLKAGKFLDRSIVQSEAFSAHHIPYHQVKQQQLRKVCYCTIGISDW